MKFDRIALKITFFILISGLVLMSTVASSQAPEVNSWEISDGDKYKHPKEGYAETYYEKIKEGEEVTFGVAVTGERVSNVRVKFELTHPNGEVSPKSKRLPSGTSVGGGLYKSSVSVTTNNSASNFEGVSFSAGKWTLTATIDPTATGGADVVFVEDFSPTEFVWRFQIIGGSPPPPADIIFQPSPTPPPSGGEPPKNNPPVFKEGASATRVVKDKTPLDVNIGKPVEATDAENEDDNPNNDQRLYYTLSGTNAGWFRIRHATGQLRTHGPLDYETKDSYSVTVVVSDGVTSRSISVTINVSNVVYEEPSAPSQLDIGPRGQNAPPGGSPPQPSSDAPPPEQTPIPKNNNNAPVFTDGASTTRSIAENTASGQNIGTAIAATDADNDTLTYTLSGNPDAAAFDIVSTSGQLQTKATLDYETKNSYAVTVTVSDGKNGSASITVTIEITDVNEVNALNIPPGGPIGSGGPSPPQPPSGGDTPPSEQPPPGGDTPPTEQPPVPQNNAPVFTDGASTTRSIAENTASGQNIGNAIAATDADSGDTLTYTLGGTDAALFSIVSTTGQLQTSTALDYETKNSYAVRVSVSDNQAGSDAIDVTISVTDVNDAPVFTDGTSTTRTIAENTVSGTNIGAAVGATDQDSQTLTYTLGGDDASSFRIVSTTGQLQTSAALDLETKNAYSVTITASDGSLTDSITVTISITDVNDAPVFTDGTSTTRSIAENTASGTNIGAAVGATDQDSQTLTYTLGGDDASSFRIVSTTGQLQTSAALDLETKNAYSVTITASDGSLTDSITVTISITDVNDAPVFTEDTSTTRTIAENTASGTNIGAAVGATDQDGQTLTYTLGGDDASSFRIVSTTGQLQTSAVLDYETKRAYAVTVTASDGTLTDTITVRISVTDVTETPANNAPVFTEGANTTRAVAENTASGQNIGNAIAATDADSGDTLTYTLGGTDAGSFSIVSTSGQLQTSAALDFETKNSYAVRVSVSDNKGGIDAIDVRISVTNANDAPVFTDGTSTTRTIAENTASGQNIGTAIAATDADSGDTLTYTLGGTDTAAFSILSTSGQLQTRAALDFETKNSYAVTVSVSDGKGGSDSISVSIDITDVAETVEQPPAQPPAGGTEQPITPPVQPPAGGTEQPIIPPVQPPVQPPASGGTQQSSTPPARSQPVTPVNHTIKPFDYERTGVGKVVFSEWMLSTLNDMPQWIELYNTTNKDINLRDWQIVGRFMDGNGNIHMFKPRTIRALTVKAKQSHLIVAYSASVRGASSENLQDNVYSLQSTRRLWHGKAIVLELQDSRGNPIDRIGNLNEQDQVQWGIPSRTRDWGNTERRISLIRRLKSVESRRYNFRFGVSEFGWFPADEVEQLTETKRSEYFYGRPSDVGTPGYRTEGADPLPVTLSSFSPQIAESGQVVLSWTTASEIENAGFNILRGESEAGAFTKVNASLIQGAGTTSDRNEYTWIDTTAQPNVEYYYRIEDMSFDGISEVVATQRLKGVFTAKNRALTRWAILKKMTE